jgi:hypothetical protein
MYKLCYHVPESHLERTKAAVFAAGAGQLGDYEDCCWQVEGQGQFRPLPGSRPFIGKQGELKVVREYRVELVCRDELIADAVAALRRAHPYEEPSYQVWRLADV